MESLPTLVSDIKDSPPTDNISKKIVIFGRPSCPDCTRVKQFLNDNAITYEFIDIDSDKKAYNWVVSFAQIIPVVILLDGEILYSPSNEELLEKIKDKSVNGKVLAVEPQVFDTVIIGGGPAGLIAAIYAVRKSLKVLLITKDIGGQAALSGSVENYLGFTVVSGADLVTRFRDELKHFEGQGLWIKEGVEVKSVAGEEGKFKVKTDSSEYLGKTVIIASGRTPRMLGIKGEKELLGKGVANCATCDAPLFHGKSVAVVGGGNSALDAVISLMKMAKQVMVINLTAQLTGDPQMIDQISKADNVKVLNNTTAVEILGSQTVSGLKIENQTSHTEEELAVEGVFVEIGWVPSVDFVPNLAKDKLNQIIVDEFGQTSVPGIWAAGDVNNLWGEQIIIAAGEGAKTALVVAEHIAKIPHQASSNLHHE